MNQCDGCQAGIPLINGTHRMGEPGGYPNKIKCTAHLYTEQEPSMKPEPCEFTSLELINIAIQGVQQAIANPREAVDYLGDVVQTLAQAAAQLEHNKGEATPFPKPKDPWAWEDADTFCPS